jgi:hypothetical protein
MPCSGLDNNLMAQEVLAVSVHDETSPGIRDP